MSREFCLSTLEGDIPRPEDRLFPGLAKYNCAKFAPVFSIADRICWYFAFLLIRGLQKDTRPDGQFANPKAARLIILLTPESFGKRLQILEGCAMPFGSIRANRDEGQIGNLLRVGQETACRHCPQAVGAGG
jgi:hypothetical protein